MYTLLALCVCLNEASQPNAPALSSGWSISAIFENWSSPFTCHQALLSSPCDAQRTSKKHVGWPSGGLIPIYTLRQSWSPSAVYSSVLQAVHLKHTLGCSCILNQLHLQILLTLSLSFATPLEKCCAEQRKLRYLKRQQMIRVSMNRSKSWEKAH